MNAPGRSGPTRRAASSNWETARDSRSSGSPRPHPGLEAETELSVVTIDDESVGRADGRRLRVISGDADPQGSESFLKDGWQRSPPRVGGRGAPNLRPLKVTPEHPFNIHIPSHYPTRSATTTRPSVFIRALPVGRQRSSLRVRRHAARKRVRGTREGRFSSADRDTTVHPNNGDQILESAKATSSTTKVLRGRVPAWSFLQPHHPYRRGRAGDLRALEHSWRRPRLVAWQPRRLLHRSARAGCS